MIRTYRTEDFEQVWALHREGMLATTSQYPDAMEGYEDDLRDIEGAYLVPGAHFWVAETDGQLVGMTAIARTDEKTGRLRRMRVTEAWRRKGLAQALLETAERFCLAQGYTRIILDTTEHQVAAHGLYEKNGFRRTGERSLGPFTVYDYVKELG